MGVEKQRQAEQMAALLEEYQEVREQCLANPELNRILHEGQTLTGDQPPNGDPCYEDEIVPVGDHVVLLRKIVVLIGFPKKELETFDPEDTLKERLSGASNVESPAVPEKRRGSSKDPEPEPLDPEQFWGDDVADDWKILQEMIGTEMQDGCVDAQSLEAALPAPRAFLQLKRRVEDELERRRFEAYLDAEKRKAENPDDPNAMCEPSLGKFSEPSIRGSHNSVDFLAMQAYEGIEPEPKQSVETGKPSFEQLCRTHRMTMARMHWLHAQFVDFLKPIDGVKPTCGYPENPAALTRNDVKSLMAEVKPEMTLAEFEEKFDHIDTDGSGELEFDEFVQWLGEDELELDATADTTKPSKEDLAARFKVSLHRIEAIHQAFAGYLPAGEVDDYPNAPKALSKECIQKLVKKYAPDISDDEFDEQFMLIDMDNSEMIEFDEFLEFLDFDEIQGLSEPVSPSTVRSQTSRPFR